MQKTKNQKRRDRRKTNKAARQIAMEVLINLWFYIRVAIDYVIDLIFGFFYDESKNIKMPSVSKPFLNNSAVNIAEAIRKKKLKSEEVVRAYIERIQDINGFINAVVDNRFEDAIKEAQKIDEDIQSGIITNEDFKNKPFLGVPFTTKESTSCAGMSFTFGLICRKDVRAAEDADVIVRMKSAGAILIAVTNVPEFNLWQETRSSLFGQTLNPYNLTRTTGGSSGGEASLIAACGTAMGLGTDIGGSIRMPAFYCGIFGHKPSSYLISTKGLTRRTGKEEHTMVVPGPMSRYAADLAPILKILVGSNINKLKLDVAVDIRALKYCYIDETKDVRVSPVCSKMKQLTMRVVSHFDEILYDDQQVKKLEIEELKWCFKLWRYWMSQEGVNLSSELNNRESELNAWVEIFKKFCGTSNYTLAAIMVLFNEQVLPKENEKWAREITKSLKENLLNELGSSGVLICPSNPSTAGYHYSPLLKPYNFAYWTIFNVLQFPVTQVPLGLSADGLPVGIQVVSTPYNDHLCIAVAKHLEEVFGGYVPPFKTA